MKAAICILAMLFSLNALAKKRSNKKRISFKRIGQVVQNNEPNYKINLDRAEPRVKLTRFCNSDTLPTTVQVNSNFSNCLDDSRPASSERQREEGFLIQIQ